MLISDKMNQELNKQVGSELGASNQYVNVAAYFDNEGLPELSGFFFRQSAEERVHAMRFVDYILDAGGKVAVPAIEAPPSEIDSAEKAVELSLNWEMQVTGQINALMDLVDKGIVSGHEAYQQANNKQRNLHGHFSGCGGPVPKQDKSVVDACQSAA